MWLINVNTYKLELHINHDAWRCYPYAILSHTWQDDEVTFQDIQNLDLARMKAGFWKIEQTCEQAKRDELCYAWIDTCCIDKSSSAELQEAINSMFKWYAQARQCYAYLSDVNIEKAAGIANWADFRYSRWFTRGWTLQELLAPSNVRFFGKAWIPCGSRVTLKDTIALITGIDAAVLSHGPLAGSGTKGRPSLNTFSIAKRMSWAARRNTTRVEDLAYALLGMFGINMPLLYGEGLRAFVRLQEEILRSSEDLSILLWERAPVIEHFIDPEAFSHTLLAPSPEHFRRCGSIQHIISNLAVESAAERTISSVGLKTKVRIIPEEEDREMIALVECYDEQDPTKAIGLYVTPRAGRSMGNSSSHAIDSARETLYLTPRSSLEPKDGNGRPYVRTVKFDALDGELESTVRTVVLSKEETLFQYNDRVGMRYRPSRYNTQILLKESSDLTLWSHGVQHVWLRPQMPKTGPRWEVVDVYPAKAWRSDIPVFDATTWNDNILHCKVANFAPWLKQEGAIPFLTGAIVLQRHDLNNSRVVISFACLTGHVGVKQEAGVVLEGLYARIDRLSSDDGPISIGLMRSYCREVIEQDVVAQYRNMSGVQLYEGTRAYDGSALILKLDAREIGTKRFGVLHLHDLASLDDMEKFRWKFSSVS